ncbi:MAG TPA: class I SAM-dependent methyltransferase [Candidatus Binatia bacterium]|nr:class I SAM-dependent methyltransferase [Candidatus Binatia bacterium]
MTTMTTGAPADRWSRLGTIAREQGLGAMLAKLADAIAWRLYPARRRFLRELLHEREAARRWDAARGVETAAEIELVDTGIERHAADLGNGLYRGVWPGLFEAAMEPLPPVLEEFTFVDFGSGKGKALLLASDYPFRAIVGVEYSQPLHDTAEQNLRRYRHPSQRCTQLQAIHGDALEYTLPPGPVVCYFFNPFATPLLAQVFARIAADVAARPRPAYVVYTNPRNVNEHRAAFEALRGWRTVARSRTAWVLAAS